MDNNSGYLKLSSGKKELLRKKLQPKLILPKLTTILINLIKFGPRIIMRSTMQLLRANIWIRIVSTLVMLLVDIIRYLTGRISKKQFALDVALSLSLLVGGTAGWYAGTGAIVGIVAENTVLWIVAGMVGAGVLGAGLEYLAKSLLARFITSDADDILLVFNRQFDALVRQYNLKPEQAKTIAAGINLDSKICLLCFKAANRESHARKLLEPYFLAEENLKEL